MPEYIRKGFGEAVQIRLRGSDFYITTILTIAMSGAVTRSICGAMGRESKKANLTHPDPPRL